VKVGGANVGGVGGGGAGGTSGEGVPLNLPIPGKRSPTVSDFFTGMPTEGVREGGGGGGAGATVGAVGITQSVGLGGAGVCQSAGVGGVAVSQSGVAGADGAGTRPSATRRGSTSSVMRSPCGAASVG